MQKFNRRTSKRLRPESRKLAVIPAIALDGHPSCSTCFAHIPPEEHQFTCPDCDPSGLHHDHRRPCPCGCGVWLGGLDDSECLYEESADDEVDCGACTREGCVVCRPCGMGNCVICGSSHRRGR